MRRWSHQGFLADAGNPLKDKYGVAVAHGISVAQPKARKEHRHLATVKQRSGQSAVNVAENDQILPAIEPKFWESLANTDASVQVIVLDNKEPPADLQDTLNVHLFAGPDGPRLGLRAGFIPPKR